MKNYAIILASGTGNRFGGEIAKQFFVISGKTILEHSIEVFEKSENIDEIIVVITPQYRTLAEDIIKKNSYRKVKKLVNGGATRKESSNIGVLSVAEKEANVLIHDCARPFLSRKIINDCIKALDKYDAAVVAVGATDTILKTQKNTVVSIPKRDELMQAQTPQCFKLSLIKKAHELAKNDNDFTDDCSLIVKYNLSSVHIVQGDIENIKITYKSDIYKAEKLFETKSADNQT